MPSTDSTSPQHLEPSTDGATILQTCALETAGAGQAAAGAADQRPRLPALLAGGPRASEGPSGKAAAMDSESVSCVALENEAAEVNWACRHTAPCAPAPCTSSLHQL
jgi:hypothetical protein